MQLTTNRERRCVSLRLTLLAGIVSLLISTLAFAGSQGTAVKKKNRATDADIDSMQKNCLGMRPLHCAAYRGEYEIINELLLRGYDVNEKDRTGSTPLIYAASNGVEKSMKILLRNGANVHARDGNGLTALHKIVEIFPGINRGEEIVAMLLASGADINDKDDNGYTPLHWAIESGEKTVVKMLLARGADANATCSGRLDATPLHLAVTRLDIETISFLLAHGAKINAVFEANTTPLGLAFRMAGSRERNPKLMPIIGLLTLKGGDPTPDYGWSVHLKAKDLEFIVDSLPDGFISAGEKRDFTRFLLYAGEESTSSALSGRILAKFTPLARRRKLEEITVLIRTDTSSVNSLHLGRGGAWVRRKPILKTALLIANTLDPPPVVSEDAWRRLADGNVKLKKTNNKEDLQKTEEIYFQAINLAPWWRDAYYNMAVVKEMQGELYPHYEGKTGKSFELSEAIWNYKSYLLAAPYAPDASQTKMRIYELESMNKGSR